MRSAMTNPLPILVYGAAGRMGRMIVALAAAEPAIYRLAGAIERADHPDLGQPMARLVPGAPADLALSAAIPADAPAGAVAIDFSLPEGTLAHLADCRRRGHALVIGTTGFSDAQRETIRAAGAEIAVLLTPNTSLGVNVLFWLARHAARLLGPEYEIEIVEMHHHHKKDAPSGTARRLAEVVAETRGASYDDAVRHGRAGLVGERPAGEIGMHALRGGDVIGDHTMILAGPHERLELTHRAQTRELFAAGALRAARWLGGRAAGFYSMDDLLGL